VLTSDTLGVIAYQLVTGKLPYGTQIAKIRTPAQLRKLNYRPATDLRPDLPEWVDSALQRSVAPDPSRRYEALSEFTAALRRSGKGHTPNARKPIAHRNPVLFWKILCALLAAVVFVLLYIIGQA